MDLRKPPSLLEAPVDDVSRPGRLFQVISHGYGLMPSATRPSCRSRDRWATVAYLSALQLSQAVRAGRAAAPTCARRAEKELR